MQVEQPSIDIAGQLERLKRRGLAVPDDALAQSSLQFISYFRLSAYWSVFEEPVADAGEPPFRKGASFDDVLALYAFDRELRLLALDAIERVEVAFRASWTQHMTTKHGPHGYLERRLYLHQDLFAKHAAKLAATFKHATDAFAARHRRQHGSAAPPPVWMAAEVLSLGSLSKWLRNLRGTDKKAIARPFGMSGAGLASACHHLTYVRNICAHHGRLWNKRFTVTMTASKLPPLLRTALQGAPGRRLYSTLAVLAYLLPIVSPGTAWPTRLARLLRQQAPRLPSMGFPDGWQAQPLWGLAGPRASAEV